MSITRRTSFQAAPVQAVTSQNYLDIQNNGWAQQYLPDLMEKEAEVYGKRTISGFLSQVGAEEAMSADQVIWSEQGRLHLSYECDMLDVTASTINITKDIDGVAQTTTHGIRVGDQVLIAGGGQTVTARVSVAAAGNQTITVQPYRFAHMTNAGFANGDNTCTILVFGSENAKGVAYVGGRSNEPSFTTFTNKPIILKDMYEVSGSDAAQVGWVEVSGEEGQNGYYWYLKAEGDTRARFTDYLEMSMIESELVAAASAIALPTDGGAGTAGTEGLFAAIRSRGNQTSGVTGTNPSTDFAEFDLILAEFDRNGAIEENMMFVNRGTSLAMDDMLASLNSGYSGGTSYGVFNNSEDMALNLGFSGFRRGSYDFYKSDWKYLNDLATRGGINNSATAGEDIRGVVIPAGTSSVYDQQLGKNLKRPFLHVRYRASQLESRKMKTWVTGSVGAATSDLDAMTVNFLSERCLITQGANNFMLMN
jgi:hypothetical protein|tara:strand:- start:1116 stop:2549 length:1434 start_codon:yes stop_codon:yes gene_type:complete